MADEQRKKLPADLKPAATANREAAPDGRGDTEFPVTQRIETFYSGPLPDPHALRAYAELIPNGAERIMALVERAATHRHEQEDCGSKRSSRGQWMAFVLTLVLTAAGLFLGVTGHDWLAAGLFTTTISAVVTIFALGNRTRSGNEKKSKTNLEK
jgi:uncharacterized membrane protein